MSLIILAVIGNVCAPIAAIYIWIVIALIFAGIPVAIISWGISFRKRFRDRNKELKLLRMELGKFAEEAQLLRKKSKDSKEDNSST